MGNGFSSLLPIPRFEFSSLLPIAYSPFPIPSVNKPEIRMPIAPLELKCLNAQTFRCLNAQVFKHLNVQIPNAQRVVQ